MTTTVSRKTKSPLSDENSTFVFQNKRRKTDSENGPNSSMYNFQPRLEKPQNLNSSDTLDDSLEPIHSAYSFLKNELERKEIVIRDLVDRLQNALENIQKQSITIRDLKLKMEQLQHQQQIYQLTNNPPLTEHLNSLSPPSSKTAVPFSSSPSRSENKLNNSSYSPSHEKPIELSSSSPLSSPVRINHSNEQSENNCVDKSFNELPMYSESGNSLGETFGPQASSPSNGVYLKLITQPPSQAIYQRILRPFPGVMVVGSLESSYSNYFIEVSLLKKSSSFDKVDYHPVTWFKNGGSPLEGDKEKNLINGQAVFRKLKILTTSCQHGAFFVLKFTLKRYVNSLVEVVPFVKPIISNPIEVFSHTLYLKSPGPKNRPSSKSSPKRDKNPTLNLNLSSSSKETLNRSSSSEELSSPINSSPNQKSSPSSPSSSEEENTFQHTNHDHINLTQESEDVSHSNNNSTQLRGNFLSLIKTESS